MKAIAMCPTCHKRKTLASLPRCPICERWCDDPVFSRAYISSGYREPEGANEVRGTHHKCDRCGIGFWGLSTATRCPVCNYAEQYDRDRAREAEKRKAKKAQRRAA